METEQNNINLNFKYFELTKDKVYSQIECKLSEEQLTSLKNTQEQSQKETKKSAGQNNIMLFLDRSGSMSGKCFEVLKEACVDIGERILFEEDSNGNQLFNQVKTYFYDTSIMEFPEMDKSQWIQEIKNTKVQGCTNFIACFQQIMEYVLLTENADLTILFFTDGSDTCNSQADVNKSLQEMKNILQEASLKRQVQTKILTIGLSRNHEAKLLNELAQAGSQLGNFIYVDTAQSEYLLQIQQSLGESMEMAVANDCVKILLNNDEQKYQDALQCQEIGEAGCVEYFASSVMNKTDIMESTLKVQLQLSRDHQVKCVFQLQEIKDVDSKIMLKAKMMMNNQTIYDLIQKIQKNKDDYSVHYQELQAIDTGLKDDFDMIMKITNDSQKKKELMTELTNCKQRASSVIEILRGNQKITNEMIAKLNDVAYKGIKKGGLQKMVDKRALKNEALYQKSEQESKELVSKMDMSKIQTEHSLQIESIGNCVISTMTVIDAMTDCDCMCIALAVNRPEAAVADPSRLIIQNVFPSYMTTQSFIQSSAFMLAKDDIAHGGFGKDQGKLVVGQQRENINAIMGLYLFEEHWQLMTKNVKPVYGLIHTCDVMGYSSEQYFTLPFLVYQFLLGKQRETEMDRQIFDQVKETCQQIISHHKVFQQECVQKVIAFARQPGCESSRTADVIKSVSVLFIQFFTLLEMKHKLDIEEFRDEQILQEIKVGFVRFVIEEILRRNINRLEKTVEDQISLLNLLFKENQSFINTVFQEKKLEIDDQYLVQDDGQSNQNEQITSELMTFLGYSFTKQENQNDEKENKESDKEKKTVKKVDLQEEVNKIVSSEPWSQIDIKSTIKETNDRFTKYFGSLINLMNQMLDKNINEIVDLYSMPLLEEKEQDKEKMLLAIIIQNGFQKKNSDRVGAIQNKTYVQIDNAENAKQYLGKLLNRNLINNLKSKESSLIKSHQDQLQNVGVYKAMKAKDHFEMAAIIKQCGMYSGRGDFIKMFKFIIDDENQQDGDVLLKKLQILKYQSIFSKTFNENNPTITIETVENQLKDNNIVHLYCDSKVKTCGLRKTYVRQIWSKYVYLQKIITAEQLINIFPEREREINIWNTYCDEKGYVKRNLQIHEDKKIRERKDKNLAQKAKKLI